MDKFSDYNLPSTIIKALKDKGIEEPTPIQSKAIPVLLNHDGDFIGRASTGTGKTIAFGIPLISKIDTASGTVQAVVLVPTRELCEQVGVELTALTKGMADMKIEAIYGGVSLKEQITELSQGTNILVATPGRMVDLIKRKVIDLSVLKTVVIDEADQMLLQGFQNDIDKILTTANKSYATWLFSATMPDQVNAIVKKYLKNDLVKVLVDKAKSTSKGIRHQVITVTPEEKQDVLLHFLNRYSGKKTIIFCRTKSGATKLYKQLSARKITAGTINGDLPQGLRNKMMDQFRSGSVDILVATEVASRGVDVEDVELVIQYHIPETADSYTHRSGRTSRAGKSGVCLSFVFTEEKETLNRIEQELDIRMQEVPVPSAKDQLVNKAIIWARKVSKEKPVGDKLDEATKQDFKKHLTKMSKDELLEKFLANYLREHQD